MNHRATPDFWYHYRQLPTEIQELADRCYTQLKQDPRYPSLHFKKSVHSGQFALASTTVLLLCRRIARLCGFGLEPTQNMISSLVDNSKLFMQIQGIKRGQTIELLQPLDLPDGCEITISIQPKMMLSLQERQQRLLKLCGAWSDQPDLDAVFAQIDQERHQYRGRDILSFD